MKQYWPMATRKSIKNKLFTIDACKDVHECAEVFNKWEEMYNDIDKMWIDLMDGDEHICFYDVYRDYIFRER